LTDIQKLIDYFKKENPKNQLIHWERNKWWWYVGDEI